MQAVRTWHGHSAAAGSSPGPGRCAACPGSAAAHQGPATLRSRPLAPALQQPGAEARVTAAQACATRCRHMTRAAFRQAAAAQATPSTHCSPPAGWLPGQPALETGQQTHPGSAGPPPHPAASRAPRRRCRRCCRPHQGPLPGRLLLPQHPPPPSAAAPERLLQPWLLRRRERLRHAVAAGHG